MLEVLSQDYIRTAHAKGLKKWTVVIKHALRNALIPIITPPCTIGKSRVLILSTSIFPIPGIENTDSTNTEPVKIFVKANIAGNRGYFLYFFNYLFCFKYCTW